VADVNRVSAIGSFLAVGGVVLVIAGHGYGETGLSIAGFGLQRAGPGVVLMVLGVAIMKFTRHRRHVDAS
jgi:hypothetical protein